MVSERIIEKKRISNIHFILYYIIKIAFDYFTFMGKYFPQILLNESNAEGF